VTSSTFSGNSASDGFGGAIYNDGTLGVINSTFSDNSAYGGGAIRNGIMMWLCVWRLGQHS
jgi:predicted outer membrane repeat protein